jgi:hypothetical protein
MMMSYEILYAEYEKLGAESKEKQLRRKEVKDEMIAMMNEQGIDEIIIEGLDSPVMLSITYPERELLNKKGLAEAMGVPQKELSKPFTFSKLVEEGKLTSELIEKFTMIEERMQFSAKEHVEQDED